jgi:hypothetical protein
MLNLMLSYISFEIVFLINLFSRLKYELINYSFFSGQGRVNQLGGVFINGRPLPYKVTKVTNCPTEQRQIRYP